MIHSLWTNQIDPSQDPIGIFTFGVNLKTHLSWFFNFWMFSFIEFSRLAWLVNSFSRASRNFIAEFFNIPMIDSLDSIAALICLSNFSISALFLVSKFSKDKKFRKKKILGRNFETYLSAFSALRWRFSRFFWMDFQNHFKLHCIFSLSNGRMIRSKVLYD